MARAVSIVCADTQCISYIIDVMQGIEKPCDDLADEKIALLRCYLYLPGTLYGTPKVMEECGRIPDQERRDLHDNFLTANFDEVQITDTAAVDSITETFRAVHSDEDDCKVVAEAKAGEADNLLTYDFELIAKLSGLARPLQIVRPTEYWNSLGIPSGSQPDKIPHRVNPLAEHDWWVW